MERSICVQTKDHPLQSLPFRAIFKSLKKGFNVYWQLLLSFFADFYDKVENNTLRAGEILGLMAAGAVICQIVIAFGIHP